MPSFELPSLKSLSRGSSISAPLSRTTSPRNFSAESDRAAGTPTAASAAAAADKPSDADEDEATDVLDMRQHDEMIRDTLKTLHSTHTQRTNLFGLAISPATPTSRTRVAIVDEVRFGLWLGLVLMALTALIFLIVVAVRDDVQFSDTTDHPHGTAIIVAGIFALLACFLTAFQVYSHWRNWTHPPSQKLIVRILLMVPVYAVSSWVALVKLEYSTYIDFVRICYEAFTLYTFMVLLTVYLGGHGGVVEWLRYKEPVGWILPLNCLPRCEPTSNFLWYLKYSCLQYAVIAPIAMFIAVICESFHAYGDGEFNLNQGYLYCTILINCTQLVSLYSLAWLYVIMKKELTPFSPVTKFACIKGVVFFTFWQGVGLAVLVKVGAISETENFSTGEVQVGLQDFIICIEMFIFACLHKYAFGHGTYADGSLALLMEQRSTFITQLTYKRAVDEARKELEERERLGAVVVVPQHEHVVDKAAAEHKMEVVPEKAARITELTDEEKDEVVMARAAELVAISHQEEQVLGDDKFARQQLPNTAAQSKRDRATGGAERTRDTEMVEQQLRADEVQSSTADSEDLLHDVEES